MWKYNVWEIIGFWFQNSLILSKRNTDKQYYFEGNYYDIYEYLVYKWDKLQWLSEDELH